MERVSTPAADSCRSVDGLTMTGSRKLVGMVDCTGRPAGPTEHHVDMLGVAKCLESKDFSKILIGRIIPSKCRPTGFRSKDVAS